MSLLLLVGDPGGMGYTTISQTPVVTGLYTLIFPTMVFALLGSSRLLVVGADSATAAILAAGLASLGIAGLAPNSAEWVAWSSLVALVCAGLFVVARLFRLGFIGRLPSAPCSIGFLTGVGIQVFARADPRHAGDPEGQGNWFEQQWSTITHVGDAHGWTVAFALGTLAIILGFKRFLPKVPGGRRRGDPVDHPVGRSGRFLARCGGDRLGTGRLPAGRAARMGSPGATCPRSSESDSRASC